MHGTFAECVQEVLDGVDSKLAPTFLFVDPCGVSTSRTSPTARMVVSDATKPPTLTMPEALPIRCDGLNVRA